MATGSFNWTWQLLLSNDLVAASSRGYQRQRECAYNLSLFLDALALATISDADPVSRHLSPVPAPRPSTDLRVAL